MIDLEAIHVPILRHIGGIFERQINAVPELEELDKDALAGISVSEYIFNILVAFRGVSFVTSAEEIAALPTVYQFSQLTLPLLKSVRLLPVTVTVDSLLLGIL